MTDTLAARQRRADAGRAAREIDHRRHAADRLQGEERDGDAGRVRQHHADRRAGWRERLELAAQHLGAEDQLGVAELGAERIGDRRLAGVARALGIGQRGKQRAVAARRLDGGVDHDVLQRQARRPAGAPCPCSAGSRLSLRGGRNVTRDLGEQRLLDLRRAAGSRTASAAAPSMRTGTTQASALSAIMAAPS